MQFRKNLEDPSLPPLFYDLDLIAVCLFLIKSTDTFDNVIAFFGLYDIADFIRSQIKSRFLSVYYQGYQSGNQRR